MRPWTGATTDLRIGDRVKVDPETIMEMECRQYFHETEFFVLGLRVDHLKKIDVWIREVGFDETRNHGPGGEDGYRPEQLFKVTQP